MPVLEAALFARVPVEDLQLLLLGGSKGGSNLGPFFKWVGSQRAAFANAESYNEASGKLGAVSRHLFIACLRNKTTATLKVSLTLVLCDCSPPLPHPKPLPLHWLKPK